MAGFSAWLKQRVDRDSRAASIPDGQCVYAVGDIHGRLDLLDSLLERIWADAEETPNTLIFLGDYVDRGPASKGVVDRIMSLQRPDWTLVKLRGNHEQLLLEFVKDPGVYQAWRTFGGAETLLSYGVRPPSFSDEAGIKKAHSEFMARLPREQFAFLTALPLCHIIGDYCFAHAGVRPGVALDRQSAEDLLWIRDDFLWFEGRLGKRVVHGHTPSEQPVVTPNRIGIDTGAYATDCLTAVKLVGKRCTFLSTRETNTTR